MKFYAYTSVLLLLFGHLCVSIFPATELTYNQPLDITESLANLTEHPVNIDHHKTKFHGHWKLSTKKQPVSGATLAGNKELYINTNIPVYAPLVSLKYMPTWYTACL